MESWQHIAERTQIKAWQDLLTSDLWWNKNIRIGNKSKYNKHWFQSYGNGNLISFAHFKTLYNVKADFLEFLWYNNLNHITHKE